MQFETTLQSRPWVMAHRSELTGALPSGWTHYRSAKEDVLAQLAGCGLACKTRIEQDLLWRELYEQGLLEANGAQVRFVPGYFEELRERLAQDAQGARASHWITEVSVVLTAFAVGATWLLRPFINPF